MMRLTMGHIELVILLMLFAPFEDLQCNQDDHKKEMEDDYQNSTQQQGKFTTQLHVIAAKQKKQHKF